MKKNNKNILIVDMQTGFLKQTDSCLIENINNYLLENKFNNVFYTKCTNTSKSPFTKLLKWNGLQDENEKEIAVLILKNGLILEKDQYALNQKHIKLFKKLKINEIEICGTDSDACVLAIAFQLFDNNIRPVILENLITTSSKNPKALSTSLEIMRRNFGKDSIK